MRYPCEGVGLLTAERTSGSPQMTVSNTAAVFAPNLLRSDSESIDQLADTVHVVNIVAVMIQLADRVFGVSGSTGDAQPTAAALVPPVDSEACGAAEQAPSAASRSPAVGKAEPTTRAGADTPGKPQQWYYVSSKHQQVGPVRAHPPCLQRTETCTSRPSLRVCRWTWPRCRACCER